MTGQRAEAVAAVAGTGERTGRLQAARAAAGRWYRRIHDFVLAPRLLRAERVALAAERVALAEQRQSQARLLEKLAAVEQQIAALAASQREARERHTEAAAALAVEKRSRQQSEEALRSLSREHQARGTRIDEQKRLLAAQAEALRAMEARTREAELERQELYREYNRLLGGEGGEPWNEGPPPPAAVPPPLAGLRGLNIGCGRRRQAGYVNADLDPGVRPDVVLRLGCDLPFRAATFDRVEAYHVLEHVEPWVAVSVIAELRRVLKPGGHVVVECPNIEAAAWWLMTHHDYGWQSQMGMWPLYGDPTTRNPLLLHRWGYTAGTLRAALLEAGFVDVRRESPETHVQWRDLRLLATNPPSAA